MPRRLTAWDQARRDVPRLVEAWERMAWSADLRARWLVDFARRDLNEATRAAREALGWEARAFVSGTSYDSENMRDLPPAEALAEAQRWFHGVLRRVASGDEWQGQPGGIEYIIFEHKGRLLSSTLSLDQTWVQGFQHRVLDLLRDDSVRMRVCTACRALFVANKRQEYCSPACSQAARTQKYRAKHKARLSEARRAAYEREVRAVNPKARIARRKPTGGK